MCIGGEEATRYQTTTQRIIMTSQQLLQTARNVLVGASTDAARPTLQKAALAAGRTQDQVSKASTMRLALWSRGFKSAI
jgi:hypothetical protein